MPITAVYPVPERAVSWVPEAAGAQGTPPSGIGTTMPVASFKPADRPEWLRNTAWYGDMGMVHGVQQGPLLGGFDVSGPAFLDQIGHCLYNILGDYTVQGTAASPASTVSAPIAAGATTLTVASGGASFTAGMNLWIEDGGTPALNEVVTVASSTGTTITLVSPTRYAHLTATPFTNTTAPYTHVFALLNTNTNPGTGNGAGQPPTHTVTDRTGIPSPGLAAQYSYSVLTELVLTGEAEQLVTWEAKALSQVRTIPASPVGNPNPSTLQPVPSWRSTVKLTPFGGGSLAQVNDIGKWVFTIARDSKAIFANSGSQQPYVIPRGKGGLTGQLMFTPAISEDPLKMLLANTQPQIQMVCSNGLSGANLASIQVDIALAAYQTSDLQEDGDLFGYEVPFEAVDTGLTFNGVTMTGASGMAGPCKITLVNAIASF